MSAAITRFFLGANTPSGFYSLYDSFVDTAAKDTLYIIKGGPGCGKSSFMKRIASEAVRAGKSVEYIHCSGDPESLDAVYFPELHLGYVDGTAPHIIEPRYPGAAERYLNLGIYYDSAALSKKRAEIVALMTAYKNAYNRAYSLISAAEASTRDMYEPLLTSSVKDRILSRASGIISREIRGTGLCGGIKKRFLGALTCTGRIAFFDTVETLAKRVYAIDNEYGFSPLLLSAIADTAASNKLKLIICLNSMLPDTVEHILIPELSLAFVSQTANSPYPGEIYRHLRLDALADIHSERAMRAGLRSCLKIYSSLEREAVSKLHEAKSLHDNLEAIYNPHVEFDGVYSLADAHIAQLDLP